LFANIVNRVRGAVLGLSQDGGSTDLFENLSVNILKGDLSNDTTFEPPLFSLVNTFKSKQIFQNVAESACWEPSGRKEDFVWKVEERPN
jgi:hypothetical protein